jgi:hypothetical protein
MRRLKPYAPAAPSSTGPGRRSSGVLLGRTPCGSGPGCLHPARLGQGPAQDDRDLGVDAGHVVAAERLSALGTAGPSRRSTWRGRSRAEGVPEPARGGNFEG